MISDEICKRFEGLVEKHLEESQAEKIQEAENNASLTSELNILKVLISFSKTN